MSDSQAERNYEAYKESFQTDLERDHLGEVVLLRDCAVVALFDSEADAYNAGIQKFGIGEFSLQRIGAEPISLGIFSAFM
ncbi:hypothetical protein [Candidatus Poriferisodalis sp.]|uniref:hypothetical protein n=1 Tax=Candidatus Poriferisodalis sp. TaxID=3101277 RepID=UPI003AF50147